MAGGPERKTIRGATAFNEMAILEEQGRQGYHLVGFGLRHLEVEASDRRWQHLRLVLPSPAVLAALRESGWEVVGRWLLFTYLKRPAGDQQAPGVASGSVDSMRQTPSS